MRPHFLIPERPFATYAEYREATGEGAVELARARDPQDLVAELQRSGLRGRGGAGFPAGLKWKTLAAHPCETRFVVCNAAEGEPGTFKDRWVLRRNPYPLIEGMLIAAHVLGARQLTIATKAEFGPELARIRQAVREVADAGLTEGLEFVVVEGPDAYLFGEEKALLNVVDGGGPLPREAHYPPYEWGLQPTLASPNPALVNNVETFARVPGIVRHGAASFRELGSDDTPGPLLFTLCGDVARPGVYEHEAGVPLSTIFDQLGGGPREGRTFRAALSGVANAVLPASRFSTPAGFGALKMAGAGLGSAGFILIDDATSIPQVARAVSRFLAVETCNQCTSCMHGLRSASGALDEVASGEATSDDVLRRAVDSARAAPHGNRCYLPVQGSVLIPSLVDRFRDDFEAVLAGGDPGQPWPLPKLMDYDEAVGAFELDPHQRFKQFDWSYDYSVDPDAPKEDQRRGEGARPADRSQGALSVAFSDEVAALLAARAEAEGVEVDVLVRRAVGEWLEV